ncbi:lipopolysaccharide assembly LapA domain-containing protein [Rhodococcus sp. IEGM 1408]|uniref:LapA family protein n=1 Tax=Rhodococcus sp. IEGM 1408 TaxID=3082220 RepID=UPI00295485C0|nr:lipopolysaccharide assembly protein LapA domain-containing protein [Rhodococcus sp. IEGM 1408]MDV8000445.1 lipopolysaccharide assembly protein LapA domain-containing protein [Rhodococcus sp. IEGM 1408]
MATRSHDPVDPQQPDSAARASEVAPLEDTHASAPATVSTEDSRDRRSRDVELPDSAGGKLGSAWVGLVLGALVTILLLIFIAQNTESTDVNFLGWQFSLPLGVLILFAAIAGALIMALFAGFRILQLRMRARKMRKISAHRH